MDKPKPINYKPNHPVTNSSSGFNRRVRSALVKRRRKLSAEITRIEKCIQKLDGSGKVSQPLRKAVRLTKKSPIKDEVLQALEAAGKKGLRIRYMASTVKRTPTHLSVWLATAGKKVKGLKRVGYGVYAYIPVGK